MFLKDGMQHRVVVLVPCYNEAKTIASVVGDFKIAMPEAEVFVFDNNSSDDTAEVARLAGATVRKVPLQGKGNVVRRMFADLEADVYVLVDGDGTYDASIAPRLVSMILEDGLDMVVGARVTSEHTAYRSGHRLGNAVLTQLAAFLFGHTLTDMLSGYRVFSRRYVKSFPAHAAGFETETELTLHALELRMPVAEVETVYRSRPIGSTSKLNTYGDGFKILRTIIKLFQYEKPMVFFSLCFFACITLSLALAFPLIETYLLTGLVPRLPTALLCVGLVLIGTVLLACGIVLDTVTRGRFEMKRLIYLSIPRATAIASRI